MDIIPPSYSLYVKNLNEKIRLADLKKALYEAFSEYGSILEIVARRTIMMRGQAFIVFSDVPSATSAFQQMQGKVFFEKPIHIQYSKTKSDVIAKRDGTFIEGDRKRRAVESKVSNSHGGVKNDDDGSDDVDMDEDMDMPQSKRLKTGPIDPLPSPVPAPTTELPEVYIQPNHILFVENLPDHVNELMLSMLFQQYPGFKEVRVVPGKAGIAFVEFETPQQSSIALKNLQGFKVTPTQLMKISFAKQ